MTSSRSFLIIVGAISAATAVVSFNPGTASAAAGGSAAPKVVGNACVYPDSTAATPHIQPFVHCYTAAQIRQAYGVSDVAEMGDGQTIVLVDAYGEPHGAQDLQTFHDTFFPSEPNPNFTAVYPNGAPDYKNGTSSGKSGPGIAAGWATEAALDIEWAYAIAPHAHIVLIGVPPAETEGVQGFPNLFKAISDQIDANPRGTIFSMSFGVTEQTFGGAAATQTARFDQVFKKGIAKDDTFFASSGDSGSQGVSKQKKDTRTYAFPVAGWPATSPYVTSVGGTQLQYGWTWNPTSDVAFNADGTFNDAYFDWTPGGNQNVVWNESWLSGDSGGGPSAIYPRPSWQAGVLAAQGNHRLIPDLAWDASVNGGVLTYASFFPDVNRVGWHIYGGTSAGSPQVAALTALAVQRAGHGFGNINPLLYAASGAWFEDVLPTVEGTAESGKLVDNRMWDYIADGSPVVPDPVPGWPVLSGYDMTTGWGTPSAPAYLAGLAGP